jgi:rare lipoprotein A
VLKVLLSSAALAALALPAGAHHHDGTALASWYGPGLHGRTTANGERYNQYGLTVAHKSLPFGTRLRICYQGCVVVRVNDRGPYIGPREFDLSQGAAARIGLIDPGVARITYTYL